MSQPYFGMISTRLLQQFSRQRRTFGTGRDSYGDATFTEQVTSGYRGFVQIPSGPTAEKVIIAGKEIGYDVVVYTLATALIGENDVLLFGSSTSTAITTRYRVNGVRNVYDGLAVDHREIYASQEVR